MGGFYAIGERDGFAVHLKCAPKTAEDRALRRQEEHLDIYASVIGVRALYAGCEAKGVTILKPLAATAWGTMDFYIEDPEGYIIAFGESEGSTSSAAIARDAGRATLSGDEPRPVRPRAGDPPAHQASRARRHRRARDRCLPQ